MKEKKQKPNYARICPKCQSLEVYQETPGASLNIIFCMPTRYKCKKCGFSGYVFPEIDLNEYENIKNKENDSSKA